MEFALLLPLLLMLVGASHLVTDVLRVRLKLQEASRFAAWEMTSFTLTDFGSKGGQRAAAHRQAFDLAKGTVEADVVARYGGMDSLGSGGSSSFQVLQPNGLRVRLHEREVQLGDASLDAAAGGVVEEAGFNAGGQVEAEVGLEVRALSFGVPFLPRAQRIQSRMTLIASGWHLPDGGDATVLPGHARAGLHLTGDTHGLYRQTARMTFRGVPGLSERVPGFAALKGFFAALPFSPTGTYVVSHAYAETSRGDSFDPDRGCLRLRQHPAKMGLHNLEGAPGLDHAYLNCFDTTPFRDTHAYDSSLGLQQLAWRGSFFMGCKHPQADDSSRMSAYSSDVHHGKQVCVDP